jgi:hypothetical protein
MHTFSALFQEQLTLGLCVCARAAAALSTCLGLCQVAVCVVGAAAEHWQTVCCDTALHHSSIPLYQRVTNW